MRNQRCRQLYDLHIKSIIIIILYYAIYGSTHKYKKAKIHLKYNLKYKNDMNTNIKAHSMTYKLFFIPDYQFHKVFLCFLR